VESFNSKLRDELLDGEIFYTLREAQILTADWRRLYNGLRPHSSCGRRPPAPATIVYQGFRLADVAPPTPTKEVATALIWSRVCQAGVVRPPALAKAGVRWIAGGRRGERAGPRWRRAVSLIFAGLAIRMTVLCVGSGAALTASVTLLEGCS
jgi:hypothetical protein